MPRRLILFIAMFSALLVAGMTVKAQHLSVVNDWIASLGILGPLVFIGIYATVVPLGVPLSVLTVLAGGLFGVWVGLPTAIVASSLAASIGFVISRYLLREQVAQWLGGSRSFKRLNTLLERKGEVVIFLIRLLPVPPFMVPNYAFGLTEVGFVKFIVWTSLGMIPANLLYVVGAGTIRQGLEEGRIPWGAIVLLLGLGLGLWLLIFFARRKLGVAVEKE